MPLHGADPARVDHPGPEHPRGFLGERPGPDGVWRGRVADVGLGLGPGERAHGGDHAAVVLEVVVGVGDVVLDGCRCSWPPRRSADSWSPCPPRAGRRPDRGRTRTRPRRCRPRRDLIISPVAGLDQRQESRPVRARRGPEDPGGGAPLVPMLGQIASAWARTKFSSSGSSSSATRRTASSSIVSTCGKASRKKPEIRTVTSIRGRPSSASGIASRPVDPPGRLVPDREHAHQGQHLADVVSAGPHGGGAPDRQPDRLRVGTGLVRCRCSSDSAIACPVW